MNWREVNELAYDLGAKAAKNSKDPEALFEKDYVELKEEGNKAVRGIWLISEEKMK